MGRSSAFIQMVQKYKRKTGHASWDENAMKRAIEDVTENNKSVKATAIKYGLSRATLQRHLKSGSHKKNWGDSGLFSMQFRKTNC